MFKENRELSNSSRLSEFSKPGQEKHEEPLKLEKTNSGMHSNTKKSQQEEYSPDLMNLKNA